MRGGAYPRSWLWYTDRLSLGLPTTLEEEIERCLDTI